MYIYDGKPIFMKQIKLLCLFLLFSFALTAQKRVGLTATFDYAYNAGDKLMKPSIGRKFTIGINVADKNKNVVGFVAAGFKGFKVNLYSPRFNTSFLDEVNTSYFPVTGEKDDSLVGASMYHLCNKEQGFYMDGTYSLHVQAGLLWSNNFLRPLIMFYTGTEQFIFRSPLFFDSGNNQEWISMDASFYEIKLGIGLPLLRETPFAINLNGGFRHIDYHNISFENVPLAEYTHGAIAERYSASNKWTLSISLIWWSNWKIENPVPTPRDI